MPRLTLPAGRTVVCDHFTEVVDTDNGWLLRCPACPADIDLSGNDEIRNRADAVEAALHHDEDHYQRTMGER